MHVLAGESALRALRSVRHRQWNVPLPEPPEHHEVALLPSQQEAPGRPELIEGDSFPSSPSLEDAGFEFARVMSNAQPDLWKLGSLGTFSEERPLELVAFDGAHKRHQKKLRTRSLPRTLPADSLIQVSPLLYFVCPEIIVLQLASKLNALQLAQIIMELCGSYSLGPDPDLHEGAKFQITPVTSVTRIRHYARFIRVRGGTATLRDALNIALEGSASPGETTLSLMMSLPMEAGGYGFGKPLLNASLKTPDDLRPFVGGDLYYLDAFWQDAFADLEYESTDFHLDPIVATHLVAAKNRDPNADPAITQWRREFITKADADRRRLRDIQFLGIHVIPVTSFDLQTIQRLDQVASALAACHENPLSASFKKWTSGLNEHDYRKRREDLLRTLSDSA